LIFGILKKQTLFSLHVNARKQDFFFLLFPIIRVVLHQSLHYVVMTRSVFIVL